MASSSSADIGFVLSFVAAAATGNWWLLAATAGGKIAGDREADRARRRAIQANNDAARDRLEMVDLQPDAARTLVLGRVRYVEGVRRRWVSGANDQVLTMVVSFAGHEVDGFEQWYVFDQPVTLDAQGWVNEAPYRRSEDAPRITTGTLDGAGGAVLALEGAPVSGGPTWAVWTVGTGENQQQGALSLSIVGSTATVSGGPPGAACSVGYLLTTVTKLLRIRPYLGAAGQNVGADLAAEYPAELTSADRMAGVALAVVDVVFDPDVYPSGRPTITALLRGARCYDPRTTATTFTENPALHALHYARHANGYALRTQDVDMAAVSAAATACDVSTAFPLSTGSVTLPRYRSACTIPFDADHAASMAGILAAMAGREAWAGGQWRIRAGALGATVATITPAWLKAPAPAGVVGEEPLITAVQSVPRDRRINRVTGSCVDPDQRYQLLPFPAVQDSVLVAAKGERAAEVKWECVSHIAHAQHLASMAIREAQAGLQLELLCGEEAALLELFDVVALDMPRYGYSGKTFEVLAHTATQTGAHKLLLAETSAAMYSVDATLQGRDPAPDSNLPAPWDIAQASGLAVTSNTVAVQDGTVQARATVTWAAAVQQRVRQGGSVEVQYAEATSALPLGEWASWVEPGSATQAVIPGLLVNRHYWFRVRYVQQLPLVRGAWAAPVLHKMAGPRGTQVFIQATEPGASECADGDLWFDTDDSYHPYARVAGVWSSVRDGTIAAAAAAASAASAAAAAAQGSADTANLALADIASDAKLTADEKPRVIQDVTVISNEQAGIDAQATDYGVTAEKTAYDAAVSTLLAHLATLTAPVLWNDLGGTTNITGATFRAKFQDVYVSRQALLDAVALRAKARLGALATKSTVGTGDIDAGAVSESTSDVQALGGASYGNGAVAVEVNWTPSASGELDFAAKFTADNVLGDSGNQVGWRFSADGGGSWTSLGGSETNNTAKQEFTTVRTVAVTGGVALKFQLRTQVPFGNPAIHIWTTYMVAALRKR